MRYLVTSVVDAESKEAAKTNVGRVLTVVGLGIDTIKQVPYDQWPIWAKGFRALSTKQDTGIGDVVARIIGDENSEAFKAWFESTFKQKCGCNGRQARWNIEYPLK